MNNIPLMVVNIENVHKVASRLQSLKLDDNFAGQITPMLRSDDETAFRAFLWAASICHSTHGGLRGKLAGKSYNGWDFLLRAFCERAHSNPDSLSPSAISTVSPKVLREILTSHFESPDVRLADLDRRSEILRETATQLQCLFRGTVSYLLECSKSRVGGSTGAYAQLDKMSTFQDELKKKSSAFLMTVHFSGRWKIADQDQVLPMIDYHRMRLLLRTGCISVCDDTAIEILQSRTTAPTSWETRLRQLSVEVCQEINRVSGLPMFDLDVLLWAHARSCCRNAPVCQSRRTENDSFYDYVSEPFTEKCVFQNWCPGATDDGYRRFWEPNIATEHY